MTSITVVEHPRLRTQLAHLGDLLAQVVDEDRERFPETLVPLWSAFGCLRTDVLEHLRRTDEEFLPAVLACDEATAAGVEPAPVDRQAVAQAMRALAAGHSVVRADAARLREVTRGYAPPEDARPGFRELYYGLAALERDLDARLRRERDLLFPRVSAICPPVRTPNA